MSRKRPPKPPSAKPAIPSTPVKAAVAPVKKSWRDTWEFRWMRRSLKIMCFTFFIAYLAGTGSSAWNWAQVKWVRTAPLTELPKIADHYLNYQYRNDRLYHWVSFRPESETPEIIRRLEPFTDKLSTLTFILYSMHLQHMGQQDEAKFWWQFARYRARYDALRCGSVKAVENLSQLLELLPHPVFPQETMENPDEISRSLHRVLDYDAKYPAENNPDDVCDALRAMEQGKFATVQRARWADIRHSLRFMTEYRINRMEEEQSAKKADHLKHPEKDEYAPVNKEGKSDAPAINKAPHKKASHQK